MEYKIVKSDELVHWGIKGMKWGVRRFQNKDGSLTPAGEKRRAKLEAKIEKLGGSSKKSGSDDSDSVQLKKKKVSEMSDAELAKATSRAKAEDAYLELRPEQKPPEKNKFAKQFIDEAVKPAMISAGKNLIDKSMNKVVEKLTNGKVDPESLEVLKAKYDKLDYKQKIDKILNPDKYLSEDDKNKRQQRAFEAENREAQRKGYGNVQERAKAERDAREAETARRAAADEAARAANEARSREYYESTYSYKGGERTDFGSNAKHGQSTVTKYLEGPSNSLTTTANISSGKSTIDFILEDSGGNVLRSYTSDDDVSYRR